MKYKELKEKRTEELKKILQDVTQKIRELNFKDANRQLKDVRGLRVAKKNIAQITTLLKERQTTDQ